MKNNKGFTILEMMIVLSIIALVFLLTLPNIQQKEKIIRSKGCEALIEVANAQILLYEVENLSPPKSMSDLISKGYLRIHSADARMETPLKSAMDRPPCDSGFTLVEMLLVLLLLSVLLLVTPLLKRQQRILLRMDVQQIREICTKAQAQAIREHKSIPIKIQGSKVYCDREIYSLQSSTSCSSMSFHYTAQGTISKAFTLNCRSASSTVQLVAQLGSGRMDVR